MITRPSVLTSASIEKSGRGYLAGNTTAELVPDEEAASELVDEVFGGFIDVVSTALRRGQVASEVVFGTTPEVHVRLLLMLHRGSTLVRRAVSKHEPIAASIDVALDPLRNDGQLKN